MATGGLKMSTDYKHVWLRLFKGEVMIIRFLVQGMAMPKILFGLRNFNLEAWVQVFATLFTNVYIKLWTKTGLHYLTGSLQKRITKRDCGNL